MDPNPTRRCDSANTTESQGALPFWRKKIHSMLSDASIFHAQQTALALAVSLGPSILRICMNTSVGSWSNAPIEKDLAGKSKDPRPEPELELEPDRLSIDSQNFFSSIAMKIRANNFPPHGPERAAIEGRDREGGVGKN